MPKKFKSPLDQLKKTPKKPPSSNPAPRRRKAFSAPTDTLTDSDIHTASGHAKASKAGQYQRKTITLPPQQIDYITQLAQENQLSTLAFYRWLIDHALNCYEAGDRPEIVIREVRGEARKSHWSGQA